MDLKIRQTKRASESFHKTVEYIEQEWSIRSAQKFVVRVDKFLKVLKKQPDIGKLELEEKGIRGFVISRHNTVFYRIKEETIILLKFFDNRQNPNKKLKQLLAITRKYNALKRLIFVSLATS